MDVGAVFVGEGGGVAAFPRCDAAAAAAEEEVGMGDPEGAETICFGKGVSEARIQ